LGPYLYLLAVDVFGHMLDDTKYNVEGLTLPKRGCVWDQTFANDIALYFKGTKSNMDKMQSIPDLFLSCIQSENQLGEVCRHLGQQREVGLAMGSRGKAKVGP